MKVDYANLVCLRHYEYDMLISQMKVSMKGIYYPKHKKIMNMFTEGVNLLWPMKGCMNKWGLKGYSQRTLA